MSACTQPGLWANRPGSNASEEEVARYLDHLEQCPFHAAMENADDRMVQRMAAFANSEAAATVIRQEPVTGRQLRWSLLLKVAAAIALAAGIVFLSMFLLRTRSKPEQAVVPGPSPVTSPSPAKEVITNNGATPTPSVAPNINSERPVPSIANVRRIYVAPADGEYNQLLRTALIEEIKQHEEFTLVSRVEDADALLETEGTRGPNVRVQLVNRAGKPLWFTTQSTSEESKAAARAIASRIISTLRHQRANP